MFFQLFLMSLITTSPATSLLLGQHLNNLRTFLHAVLHEPNTSEQQENVSVESNEKRWLIKCYAKKEKKEILITVVWIPN